MAGVSIEHLHKRFDDGTVAVGDLELEIEDGELFVMLGPSGCGKTTTLRCVAGLERQTSGDIRIGNTVVNDLNPSHRDIAMVFQFYALYPHLSVYDNIAFPLRAQGSSKHDVEAAVTGAAKMLRIDHLLKRRPKRLSGGEQQRVALGRAIVRNPQAFLMDEPLTNLDAELRADMRSELKHLQANLRTTMIYVTHDQVEAMSLGDRIGIMNKGVLEQVGPPLEVYDRPASLFCARFIGSPPINLVDVELANGALTGPAGLQIAAPNGLARGAKGVAGLRPEGLEVTEPGAERSVAGRVVSEEMLGDEVIYVVDTGGVDLRIRMPPTVRFGQDAPVGVRHSGDAPPVYDPETEQVVA
jgi:sn-glycerol 3-phosphate transport system ATP-binding protein/multiple sugar transport system ATP-binding protein